jgi:hypothetical protein
MKKIIIILTLALCSCGEAGTRNDKIEQDTVLASMDSLLKKDGPTYSMDEIYENFLSPRLQDHLARAHPLWSVPNQNKWYPKLFDKYKTDSSLVNYISADFNCDGTKDYALLLDKGKGMLAVVAFLSKNDSLTTVQLTEFKQDEGDKINYALTLFRAGKYNTSDPDLAPNERHVNLKCAAIGIGYFKELYEGGNDVFYWENGELRSCLIDEQK